MTWVNGDELLRKDGNGENVGTAEDRSCSFWFDNEYNVHVFEKFVEKLRNWSLLLITNEDELILVLVKKYFSASIQTRNPH